ncbi:binding-protein-dependent transport systems inner membrane component [Beutenbergia cavernae DSM 12333]|uniref:Binding-protein-dependent transport systems inner membrane component n=1 Tax=Beutenbergia cavernae (strain ATCC BAA-8 / DSM 12333 / CCUG 43141 / JCM 11478 / NBRC 16432 / NCIMB 13614 / HKI 0122) TaxID=471853 RepID=C5C424_BEUC1|nr:sugar ABC transporter permease [Beutenbergia cavernae]ACQ79937.1 binding-protein-dependent transport systems inner membrane component [Beutenbergia cavernae DSM 12333]
MSTITSARPETATPGATAARRRRLRARRLEPFAYIAPAFVALAVIIGYPVFNAIGTSFLNASLLRPGQDTFAGLANYSNLFASPTFWTVTARTLVWAGAALVVQVGLGLLIATTLNKRLLARGAIRTTLIVPWVVPTVLVALIWRFLLDPVSGPINSVLRSSGLLDDPPVWLADPTWALPVLVLISAWKWTPFTAVILLAGMQQIPPEQYEAAMVDGASPWQRFFHVTIPSIRTSLALVTLTTISGAINNFNGIWMFTRGGPVGATEILTTYAYRTAFMEFDFGKASAISVVIFVLMMVLAVTYFYVVEGRKGEKR